MGFFLTNLAEYDAGRDRLNKLGYEEWELEYIEGDNAELFNACGIGQVNISEWFEEIEELQDYEKAALH